jgi:hypothetical protein
LKPSLRVCVFKAHDRKAETTEPLRRRHSGKGSAVLETPPFDRNHRPARLANEAIAPRLRRSMSLLEKNVAAATLVGGQQNSLSPPIAWFAGRPPLGCRPHYAARYSTLPVFRKAGFFIYLHGNAGFYYFQKAVRGCRNLTKFRKIVSAMYGKTEHAAMQRVRKALAE